MELDKICRLCLTIKKDMRNMFTDNIISMTEEFVKIKISKESGWPDKICNQCLHQVSRCHSFKKRVEKCDEELKTYIKSLTVHTILEEQQQQQQMKAHEIQIQRTEPQLHHQSHPLIIANVNPASMLNTQQLIQFVPMITNTTPQTQLLQIRPEPSTDHSTLIVQQQPTTDRSFDSYYEDIPVVCLQSNGQQTIVNLPHHQVQQLQQQAHQQQHQQQISQSTASSSETDEVEMGTVEIQEVQDFDNDEYICEEIEDITEEHIEEDINNEMENNSSSASFYVQRIEEIPDIEQEDMIDKQLLSNFFHHHTIQEGSKFICNLCHHEFKNMKFLESHMKTIHSNWIKANCKKQPKCPQCGKSFRGPGMLKMHFKTHERENKLPTCSVCGKEFKSKSILYRHRATHFAGQKQHTCTICNKIFNSNYQLNAHVARHQKNQHCKECDKFFNSTSDLKVHLQQEHQSDSKKKKSSNQVNNIN